MLNYITSVQPGKRMEIPDGRQKGAELFVKASWGIVEEERAVE